MTRRSGRRGARAGPPRPPCPPCRRPQRPPGASSPGPPSSGLVHRRHARALARARGGRGLLGRRRGARNGGRSRAPADRGQPLAAASTCTCSAARAPSAEAGAVTGPVELREEVAPAGPFRLPRRNGMDGMLRRRGGGARAAAPPRASIRCSCASPSRSADRVLLGARAPTREAAAHGIARMRFALGARRRPAALPAPRSPAIR